MHPGVLAGAEGVAGVVIGGSEALDGAGIVGDYPIRDFYVSDADASLLVDELVARPAVEALNLVLHIVDDIGLVPRRVDEGRYVAAPVAALDLMEGYDPRVRAVGREVWRKHARGTER